MRATKELAREICRNLGICWEDASCVPTMREKPITEEDIAGLFPTCRVQ